MKKYSLNELEQMKTISESQADDLKYDDGNVRVWLSRVGVDDGMPYDNQVTVEELNNGRWETVDEYEAE